MNKVHALWAGLPYAGHGLCFHCKTESYLYGASPSTKHCCGCFEFEFDCKAPKRKATEAELARSA